MISFISVGGLALGLAVCFVIGLYLLHELSYDRFVPDSKRIARIIVQSDNHGGIAEVAPGLANAIETKLSGVETVTQLQGGRETLITYANQSFKIDNVFWADSNFTEIFPLKALKGNAEIALEQPHQAIITRSAARRLFANKEAMGKILTVELYPGYTSDYKATAVVEDPPTNLHFDFNALLSLSHPSRIQARYGGDIQWGFYGSYVYLKFNKGVSISSFQNRLTHLEKQLKPEARRGDPVFTAQPLTEIHLGPNMGNAIASQGNKKLLYIFSVIGLLILAIACFNYMNLSTARALPRADEVGVRKTVGATRKNLFAQFMAEAILTSLLAFPIALLMTELSLPFVYEFLGEQFAFSLFGYPLLLLIALAVVIFSGVISGIYPALAISSYSPAKIFKKRGTSGKSSLTLQKSLVVIQFTVVILFIASTTVIYRQMNFIQNKELGFDKEQVVYFSVGILQDQYNVFKKKVVKNASVVNMTAGPPPGLGRKNKAVMAEDSTGSQKFLNILQVDYDYIETMGLQLKNGRGFSKNYSSDLSSAVILTESAINWFNLAENAVGQTVEINGTREVIGVIEDFHNEPLKKTIQPVALTLSTGPHYNALVRLASGNIESGLADIQRVWESFLRVRPLSVSFLDASIEAQYRKQQQQATLMTVFAFIAVIIACTGLFGLTALLMLNRTKEVGIRKVLGATVTGIVVLLSKDFLKLVLLGFIIAIPIAWYAMNQWLQDFAYRIELGAGIFLLAGGLALVIALATVSWQSIRAALANPTESLRSE